MNTARVSRTSARGFTLLEILMVIVIVGALIMMSFPRIESALRSAAADRASRVVANDIELTLSAAARARKPMRVTYTSSLLKYVVTDRQAGTVFLTRELGSGTAYNLSQVTFSPASFTRLNSGAFCPNFSSAISPF